MRQIVLDTETTGLEPSQGHRVIEIGCVELVNRRLTGNHYHQYLQPNRDIDEGAIEVHGITNEFLMDKPSFEDVMDDFMSFVRGAELIIHNAPFDMGFLNAELKRVNANAEPLENSCGVLDTLVMARRIHPGQKNSLDALCKRYDVNNEHRELHGALLDAEILADVYLAITGGQVSLLLSGQGEDGSAADTGIRRLSGDRAKLRIVSASEDERLAHESRLAAIDKSSGGQCVWRQGQADPENS